MSALDDHIADLQARHDELAARVRDLRAEARRVEQERQAVGTRIDHLRKRQVAEAERARLEAVGAAMCRPVWRTPPSDGAACMRVVNIEGGHFILEWPGRPGYNRRFEVRSGRDVYDYRSTVQIDGPATLAAWRAWCAARRSP